MKITSLTVGSEKDGRGADVLACHAVVDGCDMACSFPGLATATPEQVAASLRVFARAIESMDEGKIASYRRRRRATTKQPASE